MNKIPFILHFHVILTIKIFHLNNLKQNSLNCNGVHFRKKTYHIKLTISQIEDYHVLFDIHLLLFLTIILVQNHNILAYLYIFRLRYYLFLLFYFLMWIILHIFYQNHYRHIFDRFLSKNEIFLVQHILIN